MRSHVICRVGLSTAGGWHGFLPCKLPFGLSERLPERLFRYPISFLRPPNTRATWLQSPSPVAYSDNLAITTTETGPTLHASSRRLLQSLNPAGPKIQSWVLDRRKRHSIYSSEGRDGPYGTVWKRNYTSDRRDESLSEQRDASKWESLDSQGSKRAPSLKKGVTSTMAQKHLMNHLPHMPQLQRPTKEELLAAATGFWSRLKVRFKWFSIRSARPFNADEIGAFFSWVLVGHVLWIFLGTTTFFSLAILAVNTVFAQGKPRPWTVSVLLTTSRNIGTLGR